MRVADIRPGFIACFLVVTILPTSAQSLEAQAQQLDACDSFFDPLRGDFEGNLRASDRGAQVTVAGNVALLDILGVFERRGNVTRQICEYAVTSEVKPCKDNVCIR
jgi:hypothetical protein